MNLLKTNPLYSRRFVYVLSSLLVVCGIIIYVIALNHHNSLLRATNAARSKATASTAEKPAAIDEATPSTSDKSSTSSQSTKASSIQTQTHDTVTPSPTTPNYDNSTALPPAKVDTGITIGFVHNPNSQYIYFTNHGSTADKYLFVLTPVHSANVTGAYITENYIQANQPVGMPPSQSGMGNPDIKPGMVVGDEFTVAVCEQAAYLTCGSVVSNTLHATVVSVEIPESSYLGYSYY